VLQNGNYVKKLYQILYYNKKNKKNIQLKSLRSILQLVKSLNKVSKNIRVIKYKTIRIKTD
jgi:hypothetical protein